MLSPEHQTMLQLLAYPNPEGLHPVEVRWRDFARELIREGDEKIKLLEEQIRQLETNDVPFD